MSESKTYIFGENQNGGSNGMPGLLAPLLQKQGVDPDVLLAMIGQERGFSNVAYGTRRQTCDLHNAIKESTQTIVDGQKQAEMREMQNRIDSLREENSTFKSSAMTSQIVGQAVAPVNAVSAGLQNEVAGIKCKLPETVTTPYSPFTAVPDCVACQAGLYGLNAANGAGFWG